MAGDTIITVVGNLTADPELRYTPNGFAVANFTIASTPRQFDRQSNEWKDGESMYLRASVWREYAENVAATLTKGQRVIAQGKLKQRNYETREGEKRTAFELDIDEIGPALRYATAQVTRTTGGGGQVGGGQQRAPQQQMQQQRPPANEPWGGGGQSGGGQSSGGFGGGGGGWAAPGAGPSGGFDDEPPF
ncbi:single-stranded DNA-binding protein [Gulosibacter sp. 10]|uniref:single-stranded DNA-binding protein n=1 Tax=Gulosibacter sp. 10 TaxID=1255570 RepID=UPI00097E86FB|nr:single-stranded DNA-binding protein [Gulosibacter sp. 10]SJM66958.1 Single-stranded DNA-binding protein [Gulosibacter sp. 10]